MVNDIIRYAVLFQAAFVVGISTYIFLRYMSSPVKRHIGLVALSYILLTILNTSAIFTELYPINHWRVYVGLIAYLLGDYALLYVLSVAASRRRNERIKSNLYSDGQF